MTAWTTLPRSFRYCYNGKTADVWRVGGGVRWSVLDESTGVYVAGGECKTIDEACEEARAAISPPS